MCVQLTQLLCCTESGVSMERNVVVSIYLRIPFVIVESSWRLLDHPILYLFFGTSFLQHKHLHKRTSLGEKDITVFGHLSTKLLPQFVCGLYVNVSLYPISRGTSKHSFSFLSVTANCSVDINSLVLTDLHGFLFC